MSKFIVTYVERGSEYDPPYDRNDAGGYRTVDLYKYKYLDQSDLDTCLVGLLKDSNIRTVTCYEVAKEFKPKLTTSVSLE